MSEFLYNPGSEDEELYKLPPPEQDPLGILTTTKNVVELGEHVWLHPPAIEQLSKQWIHEEYQSGTPALPGWDTHYHFHDGSERTLNWLLLLDALNFCFWADKGQPRWKIEYQGETLNGYWAEAASLKRAVEEEIPLWDAEFLSTISHETMAHIFRGQHTIPLFEQRVTNARETGRVLKERYNGQFRNAIEQVERSAIKLVTLLVQDFPSFRDIATYRHHDVIFLKRAQICVADIASAFQGQQWGEFHDIEKLTAFADYKLPQVLRHHHVIEYHPALAQQVDNQEPLPAGSEEEVEIRAATIWACELLRRSMQRNGHPTSAAQIDMRLWLMGQHSQEMRPYHRTRTIYY